MDILSNAELVAAVCGSDRPNPCGKVLCHIL